MLNWNSSASKFSSSFSLSSLFLVRFSLSFCFVLSFLQLFMHDFYFVESTDEFGLCTPFYSNGCGNLVYVI